MKQTSLKLISIRPLKVLTAKYNPGRRTISKNLVDLRASIREFGVLVPILIDKKFRLIDGHRRLACAKELSLPIIPAIVVENQLTNDELYEKVNTTSRKLNSHDMIYIFINGGEVPALAKNKILELKSYIGEKELINFGNQYVSYNVINIARNACRYCYQQFDDNFMKTAILWLVNKKQAHVARLFMEGEGNPAVLMSAIKENRVLKTEWK